MQKQDETIKMLFLWITLRKLSWERSIELSVKTVKNLIAGIII